ncbi:hypothetical protein E3N88_46035 [Mikania micrantha]|uniref:Enoyl reductase (ER) domain-containing protein n=1 Tax=Mikania micrantha TaxID=192012 RepID=A0A5N6L7Q1_9ASTR|nr:hypothetical protein E3N88_46035 [Mikania micrantha]
MAGKLMHAVRYDSYGGGSAGLKHVEVPVPAPGNGEVLIKTEAASINPIDWKIQKGVARPVFPKKFPYVPVSDVAGEVVEVGAGVEKLKAGDKVVTYLGGSGGGLAEYAVTKESITVQRPPEVSAADAACLVIAGCTALHALTVTGGLKLEKTEPLTNVLVTAGQKYDLVIHCTTGIPWSTFKPNLTQCGKVIDITPSGEGHATGKVVVESEA